MGGLLGGRAPAPKLRMAPAAPPPAVVEDASVAEAEMELLEEPKSKEQTGKYKKKRKGKAKGKAHSDYKGGGLQIA